MNSSPTPRPVALVAGASRGLGLLVARELAARGFRVVGLSRDPDALAGAQETMAGWGHDFDTRVADVRDQTQIRDVVAAVERELGPIEVAVHVAGVIQVGPAESFERHHYEEALDTMLWGPITVTQAVLPAMRARRRGRLGVVTSVGGMIAVPHLLPYSTAKFGAVGYTRGLSADLAGSGVTATTIVPGLMRTGSHVQATFVGDAPAEYAWFAPGASLPLISMDAERAARKMVAGVLGGRSIVLLSPLTKIGVRAYGLAPATADAAMGLVSRLLPSAAGDQGGKGVLGHDARARLSDSASSVVDKLTVLGRRASARFNENRRPRPAA
ncbi:SDR family NAD(P)-dependent oxidoreductase [Mobilicoccus caccae]|uniref:Ketoacyl reductase n=1 Tax=Mobilicoccus caccae TaxID=1859295 RepID=A0ABQ6IXV0_9MICO|nr:SDR family NAD(P)-dependent oxidoreductase [Mobilicoccus caccae]GMA41542.1 ketoacyl reductase [Mobilicoccus caccae]